jgi:hypothetical protein
MVEELKVELNLWNTYREVASHLDFVFILELTLFYSSVITLRIHNVLLISAVGKASYDNNLNSYDKHARERRSIAYTFKQSSKCLYPFLFGVDNKSNMIALPS